MLKNEKLKQAALITLRKISDQGKTVYRVRGGGGEGRNGEVHPLRSEGTTVKKKKKKSD